MAMKFRGLLAAVVALAALGGFLYWSQRHPAALQPKSAETPELPPLVKVIDTEITGLRLQERGSAPITLVTNQPGRWEITAPITAPADEASVAHILSNLSHIRTQAMVADHPADLNRYGLANPSLTMDITEKDDQTARLILGDRTPTGDGAYAMVPGDAHVYTIPYFMDESFNQPLDNLRDKRLLPFNVGDVTGVELDRNGQTIVIDRPQGKWQIEKPAVYRASGNAVDSLLHDLVNAKFDSSATPEEAAAGYAKAAPFETIKLTAGRGARAETDTLEVRKATTGGDFYGKASVFSGTWKLDPSVDSALTKDLDDFRNKEVFDFAFSEPLNLSYHGDGTNLSLVRSNGDWFQNGKKMDLDSVEALVSALRGLAASKLVTSGFTKPDIEITVVSQGGKLVEKIQLQKTKDGGAIAKREDGPTLYALDADTVNPLFSAASGVKPAAPAPAPAPAKKK
ncbi:MAG TPA: DUF4340 domain-containing protein [Acidobacteriaceae bacterium]|nr:DUF4340 domain-containing protein [Acidobacteriaceae bacterium]